MANKIGIVLALDGEREFTQGLKNAQQSAKNVDQQLKNLTEEYKGNANSLEALSKKQEALKKSQDAYNRTLQQAKNGQSNARKQYEETRKAVDKYEDELKEAKKALEDMKRSGDTSSKAYKEQEKAVEGLEKTLERQRLEYAKAEGNLTAWDTKVLKAEGDVRKCDKAVTENAKYLDEAAKSADGCATSIDNMGNKVTGAGHDLDTAGDSAKSFWGKMKEGMALKAGAMITDALSNIASKAIEAGKQLVQCGIDAASYADDILTASQVTGLSTDTLQEYAYAAELIDTSLEDVQGALAKNVKSMDKARKGSADYSNAYKKLGVSVTDANGNLRDSEDVFWECIDALGKVEDETERDAIAMQIFGRSAQDLNPLIVQGSAGFAKLAQEAHEAGAVLDSDTLTSLGNVDDSLQRLSSQTDAFKNAVGTTIAPAIELVADAATGVLKGITNAINPPKTELEKFLSDTEKLTGQAQEAIDASKSAMEAGAEKIASIDAAANTIKTLGESFDIFAKVDTSGVVDNVSGTAEGLKDPLDNIDQETKEAITSLEGVDDVSVKAPPGVADVASDVTAMKDSVVKDDQTTWKNLEHLKAAEVKTPPGVDDVSKDVSKMKDSVVTDTDAAKEAIEGVSGVEVEAPDMTKVDEALDSTKEGLSELQKFQIKNAIDTLAEDIPELKGAWDEVNGTLRITETEFDNLINKQKRMVMSNALNMAQSEAMNGYAKAALAQQMALDAVTEAQREYDEWNRKNGESAAQTGAVIGEYEAQVSAAQKTLDEANKAYEESNTAMEDAVDQQEKVNKAVTETAEAWGLSSDEVLMYGQSAKETADDNSDLTESLEAQKQAAEAAASAHEDAANRIREAYESAKEEVKSAFDIDPFEAWERNQEEGIAKMQESLDKQVANMTEYANNLQTVSDHVGTEITPEFMSYLEDLGTDGAQVMAELADALSSGDTDKVQALMDAYTAALDQQDRISSAIAADKVAVQMGLGELGSSAEEWQGVSDAVTAKLAEDGVEVSEATLTAFEQAKETAQSCGVQIPEGLVEGISSADPGQVESALQTATEVLQAALTGQIEELAKIAEESGVEITPKLAAAIETGGPEAEAAVQEIIAAVTEQLGTAQEEASEAGSSVGESFASSAEDKAGQAQSAASAVASSAAQGAGSKNGEFNTAGATAGSNFVSGLTGKAGIAKSAGSTVASNALSGTQSNSGSFTSVGILAGGSFANGVSAASGVAYSAGQSVAQGAYNGASGVGGFYNIGVNMASGIASGIRANGSSIADALASQVAAAVRAARQQAQIKSPSKVTRRLIGQELTNGIAAGIKDKDGYVESVAETQLNGVLYKMSQWLKKNRNRLGRNSEQLADATNYTWQTLGSRAANNNFWVDRSDKAYEKYQNGKNKGKLTASGAEKYYADVYKAAQNYIKNVDILYDVSDEDMVKYWRNVRDKLKKGSQAWYDATAQINKYKENISNAQQQQKEEERQQQADALRESLEEAEKYADRQQRIGRMSTEEAIAYWRKYREGLKKNSDEYEEVTDRIIDLKDRLKEEEIQGYADRLSAAENYVAELKENDKISVKDEIEYWRKIRREFRRGSQEYQQITQHILDCKTKIGTIGVADSLLSNYATYYDLSERAEMQYWDTVRLHYKAGTQERIEADKKYFEAAKKYKDKLKDIEDDYAQKIADTNQKYRDALQDRKNDIMGSFDLFDYFESSSASGKELLFNLQTQARGYEEWNKSIKQLQDKGILSDSLMEQLISKGPDSIANIKALLTLSNKELKEYQKAYDDKEKAAVARAKRDTEDVKKEVEKEVASLREQRTKDLEAVKKDIGADIIALARSIRNISEDQTAALAAAFAAAGNRSPAATGGSVDRGTYRDAGVNSAEVATARRAIAYQKKYNLAANDAAALAAYVGKAPKFAQKLTDLQEVYDKAHAAWLNAKTELANAQNALKKLGKNTSKKVKDAAQKRVTTAQASVNSRRKASQNAKAELDKWVRNGIRKGGYARGSRRIGDDSLIWMDEMLSGIGPEMIVRKSDNAILTRAKATDAIIPANLADNLFKWGAINPADLNTASMASLNQKLMDGYTASVRASALQTARMDEMLGLMAEFLPYLADRLSVTISSRDAVAAMSDDISRNMASRARRRAR